MPDQTQNNNQQAIVYALVAIAVLLAAIVGFMIYQRTTAIPAPTAASSSSAPAATAGTSSTGAPAGMTQAAPVPFDPKTATKLPSGMTPEQALKAYNEAILANNFTQAYSLLPVAQKQSYGSPDSMGTQIKQYGITGYKLGKPQSTGADTTLVGEQDTPAMNITYTWTFTKVGNTWYVKSRTMGGAL